MSENLQIEELPVSALAPYVRNARTHSDEQVTQIAASIREFGFTNPVLIDADGGIIAGHGRVMAARRLGLVHVPCLRLGHLTDAQKRAYIIADNQLALNAGWDWDMLNAELAELEKLDFDISLTGLDEELLRETLAAEPELKEKQEQIKPIKYTRILISIPTNINIDDLNDTIKKFRSLGAEVDYSGN